jgi:CxxC-x17-CxxC domain-containing protein
MKPVIIAPMPNYNRTNRSGGNRNFGKPRFNRERTEMFSATCANCGKQCEVPFRPNGNKPVLCRDCFQNNRGADSPRFEQKSYDKPRFNRDENHNRSTNAPDYSSQFEMLNAKVDKILALLTQIPAEAPLESSVDAKVIEEIAEEVQEEKKEQAVKKSKKTKPAAKTKKKPLKKK